MTFIHSGMLCKLWLDLLYTSPYLLHIQCFCCLHSFVVRTELVNGSSALVFVYFVVECGFSFVDS